ncbi:tetratricopeptide repeat protein [Cyanobium gracile]|uniref:CHAT domain-containing protein n=1 Tax=Cyanobium gracile (strain ATCC 27147 / PCC 6307) TaxID=292564 RepID=K9P4K9_CYAGP|nr:tetratricopeptide repeat protein [Cyanobium gracile]AFY27494.1 hypothetical protein Cyagr_0295 [Cyanobium gracile PCC 6307]
MHQSKPSLNRWCSLGSIVLLAVLSKEATPSPAIARQKLDGSAAVSVQQPNGRANAAATPTRALPEQVQAWLAEAEALSAKGAHQQATILRQQILLWSERSRGPDHPDTARFLGDLGVSHARQGAYDKAEPLLRRAVDINRQRLGNNHPYTGSALGNLGGLFVLQGAYREAEPLLVQAARIWEQALRRKQKISPIEFSALLQAKGALAQLYFYQGDYEKAQPLLETIVASRVKVFGESNPETAQAIEMLGTLYMMQGSIPMAEMLLPRALSIHQKTLGADHLRTARSMDSLARLSRRKGNLKAAQDLLEESLRIKEAALGADHLESASVASDLGMIYHQQGLYRQAEQFLARALLARQKLLGSRHPQTADSFNNLALVYSQTGRLARATELFAEALKTSESLLGPTHPGTTIVFASLGAVYGAMGDVEQSIAFFQRAVEGETLYLRRQIPLLPIKRRQDRVTEVGGAWEAAIGLAERSSSAWPLALFTRLNRQGLLQDLELHQALLIRHPAHRKAAEQIDSVSTKLASIATPPQQREALQLKRLQLEQQLYRQLPQLKPTLVSTQDIANVLPADGVLVEFQRYRPFNVGMIGGQPSWGEAHYIALILKPNGTIQAVSLGRASVIDTAITRMHTSLEQATADAPSQLAEVRRLVVDPIRPHTRGSSRWFLSPDAELNRIPFLALPSESAGSNPLSEQVKIKILTTGRDLLRLQQPPMRGHGKLVMADPDFDRPGSGVPFSNANAAKHQAQRRSTDLSATRWQRLKATQGEGTAVAAMLSTTAIFGTDASSLTLQRMQPARIVHVATHGFFLPDRAPSSTAGSQSGEPRFGLLEPLVKQEPMLRSGIVLAGANYPAANSLDDGYLTAAEATSLPLHATELVVLSACSTGQGEARTGEGVYGLQRALAVAGARSTLLSLWKVDDQATREFMVRFYQLLKQGHGRLDALQRVQAEFRLNPKQPEWRHPYYWAAWQLNGDWKPIQGL